VIERATVYRQSLFSLVQNETAGALNPGVFELPSVDQDRREALMQRKLFLSFSIIFLVLNSGSILASPKAREFKTERGTAGWLFPLSSRALPPAVKDSVVYTSGGISSYVVYALKAATGEVVWEHRTNDDGPSSPVATEEYVAFTTYSCTIDVLNAQTGEPLWRRWLAPTLHSMPTISKNILYVSYAKPTMNSPNRIEAYDLASGQALWQAPIDSEVVSAPILADGHIYATTRKGMLYRLNAETGQEMWHYNGGVIAAPYVDGKEAYITQSGHINESVGFGSTAEMTLSQVQIINWLNVETGHIAFDISPDKGLTSYRLNSPQQGKRYFNYAGARPLALKEIVVSPSPSGLLAISKDKGQVLWCSELETKCYTRHNEQAVTPAAFAGGKFFTGTRDGRLLCISPKDGSVLWQEKIGTPIFHEPIVAKGRIYLTGQRSLYCLDTGDETIDGWPMWGGSPSHNR
jgi:outer membrane protein assembly factor BamB